MKAVWQGTVLAESDQTVVVEGNHYFPPESVKSDYLIESSTHTHCPWKGQASYYHIEVKGKRNEDSAWYYPDAKPKAENIEGYIAFWKGVEVK